MILKDPYYPKHSQVEREALLHLNRKGLSLGPQGILR